MPPSKNTAQSSLNEIPALAPASISNSLGIFTTKRARLSIAKGDQRLIAGQFKRCTHGRPVFLAPAAGNDCGNPRGGSLRCTAGVS